MNELVKANLYLAHMDSDELYHHGIKGMKWGVRRYQNPDGSLTEEGKKRKRRRLILLGGLLAAGAGAVAVAAIAKRNKSSSLRYLYKEGGKSVSWGSGPVKAKLKDGRVIEELHPAAPWSRAARSTGRKVKPDYNGDTVWNSAPYTVKRKDGRVINDLYVAAPWSRAARSTGRKVTSSEYPFYHGRYLMRDYDSTAWRYDPSRVRLKDGRVINKLQPVKPWGKLARSTGRKVPKKK